MKTCSKCHSEKDTCEFRTNKSLCKICAREAEKKIRHNRKEKNKNIDLSGDKKCYRCNEIKPKTEFYRDCHSYDGLISHCINCAKEIEKLRYENNKNKNIEISRDGTKHCPKCNETKPKTEFSLCKHKEGGLFNYCKECEKKRNKDYRLSNREKILTRRNKYERNRRKTDHTYKLRCSISSIVLRALKKEFSFKDSSVWEKLPYTPKQLKEHLELQFDDNMSWDNHGSYWQIDHIYPQSKLIYDTLDHPNFLKCWCLSNLRPLNNKENNKKKNKIIPEAIYAIGGNDE